MIPDLFNGYERIGNPNRINISQYTESLFKNTEHAIIWFGRIFRGSNRQNAVKQVEVIFLNLGTNFETAIKLPIEVAHRLPIGSIWVNGVTHQKYAFDDGIAVIKENASNLTYSNHFGISISGGKFEFNLSSYPVRNLETDANTLLVINQESHKVLIHPLTFFMAHYGVSKEINRILLTYLWTDIENKLNLNRPEPQISDTIIVPDACVIADAVFLYHLKHSKHTKDVTESLNTRVLNALIKNQEQQNPSKRSAPLKVAPYHKQQIEIGFKGIILEDGVILCTEITGMSMPKGDVINYAFSEYEAGEHDLDQAEPQTRSYKPLFNKIDTNEVIVEAQSNAGNSTTAVVKQHVETIGEMRELVRVENITIDQVIQRQRGQVIPLSEPIPSAYAVGDRRGNDKAVGMLKVFISSGIVKYKNPSFKRLLAYAKALRVDPNFPRYKGMIINCYSDNQLHGETVEYLNTTNKTTTVLNVYILRLEVYDDIHYIFDCSMTLGDNRSGIGIKVANDDDFNDTGIEAVLGQLFGNDGRLSDQEDLDKLYGSIVRFNHVESKNSNWVRTVLERLNNTDTEE